MRIISELPHTAVQLRGRKCLLVSAGEAWQFQWERPARSLHSSSSSQHYTLLCSNVFRYRRIAKKTERKKKKKHQSTTNRRLTKGLFHNPRMPALSAPSNNDVRVHQLAGLFLQHLKHLKYSHRRTHHYWLSKVAHMYLCKYFLSLARPDAPRQVKEGRL